MITTKIQTKYFIDFVLNYGNNGFESACYELIRTSDDAILYSNESLDNVQLFCLNNNIKPYDYCIL